MVIFPKGAYRRCELAVALGSSRLLAVERARWLDRPGRLALRAGWIDLSAWPCVLTRSTCAPGRPGCFDLAANECPNA